MIEVMLVEDEEHIRNLLKKMVERVEDFKVIEEADNVSDALIIYEKTPVDVVFVDIDLGGESGLGLAKKITEINPEVKIVFATAHSEFMADAFEIYAFDYLVKPFNLDRVIRTLQRMKGMIHTNPSEMNEEAEASVSERKQLASEKHPDKLAVRGKEELALVDVEEILFVERNNGTTRIITTEEVFQTSMSLSDVEEKLDPKKFMRCHRSYLVNVTKIKKMTPYGRWTYTVTLKGTEETALMTYEHYEEIKNGF